MPTLPSPSHGDQRKWVEAKGHPLARPCTLPLLVSTRLTVTSITTTVTTNLTIKDSAEQNDATEQRGILTLLNWCAPRCCVTLLTGRQLCGLQAVGSTAFLSLRETGSHESYVVGDGGQAQPSWHRGLSGWRAAPAFGGQGSQQMEGRPSLWRTGDEWNWLKRQAL